MNAPHDDNFLLAFGMVLRIARGMEINEDTMATSLIKTIDP